MLVCVDWWVGVRVVKKWALRLCVVSRRKGAGREFQLGAKLAHLAEALREMRNCSAQWRESSSFFPTFFPKDNEDDSSNLFNAYAPSIYIRLYLGIKRYDQRKLFMFGRRDPRDFGKGKFIYGVSR